MFVCWFESVNCLWLLEQYEPHIIIGEMIDNWCVNLVVPHVTSCRLIVWCLKYADILDNIMNLQI